MNKIPFILFIDSPNSCYLYDATQSELCEISERTKACLKKYASKPTGTPNVTSEIQRYINNGDCKNQPLVKEIIHPYSGFLVDILNRKLQKMTLQLTQQCNLRCTYCIYSISSHSRQRSHSNERMSKETALAAIDFLCEHSVDSDHVNVGFYGGEPLLEFPLIKEIINYANYRFQDKSISFSITTNGTLLTEEVLGFFAENEVKLMISLDGPEEIHNKNRRFVSGGGSFETIIENIKLLKTLYPEYSKDLQISMVIDQENDFDCHNEITLDGRALHDITIRSTFIDREYDDLGTDFSWDFEVQYEYHMFLTLLAYWGRYPARETSKITDNILRKGIIDAEATKEFLPIKAIDCPSGPCIPGQGRLFVTTSGRFLPCERVSELSPSMTIGSIHDGFNVEAANKMMNIARISEDECKKCWAFRFCFLCAQKADVNQNEFSREKRLQHCNMSKISAIRRLKLRILMQEVPKYYAGQIKHT